MDKNDASLVFVVDYFGKDEGKISVHIQRGNAKKRVGPFVSETAQKLLVENLPPVDKALLSELEKAGLISNRIVDHRIRMLSEFVSVIASHNNLFIRTKRFGSIHRATNNDRKKIPFQYKPGGIKILGRVLGGCIDFSDSGKLLLSWRYENVEHYVPFNGVNSEWGDVRNINGQSIERDTTGENVLLREFAGALNLPIGTAVDANFSGANGSGLSYLTNSKWVIKYKGNQVQVKAGKLCGSGITWFEDGSSGEVHSVDVDKIAEAYLAGRHHIESGGNIVIIPPYIADEISDFLAIKMAAADCTDIPVNDILSVRKKFKESEIINLQKELDNSALKAKLHEYQLEGVSCR
jgi:hypothetical protein